MTPVAKYAVLEQLGAVQYIMPMIALPLPVHIRHVLRRFMCFRTFHLRQAHVSFIDILL